MVACLGDLLRLTLERGAAQEVPLSQELEFLRKYLEIEQTRFHDRLTVEINVDPQTLDADVPNMILQPLVENAIRHGLAARPGAGRIEIRAERDDHVLRLSVRDNGTGLPGDWQADNVKKGIGLRNTRQRLEQLYKGQSSFEMRNWDKGGLEVSLTIPYRLKENAPQEPRQERGRVRGG
jgi:LytS/YehU family sensor histidine kinase